MPVVVICPSCRNDLLVPGAAESYLRNCPTCGDPVTIPAAIASEPSPSAELAQSNTARRRRLPALRRSWLLIAVGCVGLVAATFGSWLLYDREEKREQAHQVLDAQFANNRALIAKRELTFWQKKGIPPAFLRESQKQATELDEVAKEKDTELDRRWGSGRMGLRELGDNRAEACGECLVKIAKGAETRLQENARAMGKELVQLEARIVTEVPLIAVEIPMFDRTTEKGEREFQEFQMLLPAKRERAKAECESARLKRFLSVSGPIVEKWVTQTRDENQQMIDELERAVLARR